MVVVIEMARRRFAVGKAFELRAVHDENIGPAVVVIIENGNTRAGGFDDVLFCLFPAENNGCRESHLCCDIRKVHDRRRSFGRSLLRILRRRSADLQGETGAKPEEKKRPKRREMESHQALRIVSWLWAGVNRGQASAVFVPPNRSPQSC